METTKEEHKIFLQFTRQPTSFVISRIYHFFEQCRIFNFNVFIFFFRCFIVVFFFVWFWIVFFSEWVWTCDCGRKDESEKHCAERTHRQDHYYGCPFREDSDRRGRQQRA